jgi:hypothetical protein
MYSVLRWLIPLLVAVVFAGVGYYLWRASRPPEIPPVSAPAAQAPATKSAAAPEIQHPIGEASPETKEVAMPPLGQSDKPVSEALAGVIPPSSLEQYFLLEGVVRRVVATVDALPRKETIPRRVLPMKPVPGAFATAGEGEERRVGPSNAARYVPLVRLMESVDTAKLIAVYVRYYPLFQQAYVELGYPLGYFNDRLIAAIDNLLSAPDAAGPVPLVQPKVLYAYADPELEALSAGQKMMLRMGGENSVRVKAKLREIRRALTAKSAQPSQ